MLIASLLNCHQKISNYINSLTVAISISWLDKIKTNDKKVRIENARTSKADN